MKKFWRKSLLAAGFFASVAVSQPIVAQTLDNVSPSASPGTNNWGYTYDPNANSWYRNQGFQGIQFVAPYYTGGQANYTSPATPVATAPGSVFCFTTSCYGRIQTIRNTSANALLNSVIIATKNTAPNLAVRMYMFSAAPNMTGITNGTAYSPKWVDMTAALSNSYVECANSPSYVDNTTLFCTIPPNYFPPILFSLNTYVYFVLVQSPLSSSTYTPAASQLWTILTTVSSE